MVIIRVLSGSRKAEVPAVFPEQSGEHRRGRAFPVQALIIGLRQQLFGEAETQAGRMMDRRHRLLAQHPADALGRHPKLVRKIRILDEVFLHPRPQPHRTREILTCHGIPLLVGFFVRFHYFVSPVCLLYRFQVSKKSLCVKIFWKKVSCLMQLYERIRLLAQDRGVSQAKLAEIVGVYPQKFSQWLNEKSQKNLWEHLPKILDAFPDIRPEWLYYDDGPMLRDAADAQPNLDLEQQLVEARAKIAALEAELREADRLNRKLTARLLVDGVGDNADASNTGKASEGHG